MKSLLIFLFLIFSCLLATISLALDKIDINTASFDELKLITGVGDVKAQAIIDARPFSSVDDLIRVKGIGEKTLENIKKQDLAYIENISYGISPTLNKSLENIFINEILPWPEGKDAEEEWIELFNLNNFEADISGWSIKDTKGRITTYTFPQKTKIPTMEFFVLLREDSKIVLNNDEDGLELINPEGKIIDFVTYENPKKGFSYNKDNGKWVWSPNLTPGSENIVPEKRDASVSKSSFSSSPSFNPSLIAIILSFFSSGIIYTLKKFSLKK